MSTRRGWEQLPGQHSWQNLTTGYVVTHSLDLTDFRQRDWIIELPGVVRQYAKIGPGVLRAKDGRPRRWSSREAAQRAADKLAAAAAGRSAE